METQVWIIDRTDLDPAIISQAAEMLKAGLLVAFPTETVYGVGALAHLAEAAEKIYQVKNRSLANPLLIHLSSIDQVRQIVPTIPEAARRLINKFWPGPLSIILPGGEHLPELVRNKEGKVGLRMPSHPVARALIEKTGPLAATSANLSGRPSPVTAAQALFDLQGKIAAIIDGGETDAKLDSTVVDLSEKPFRILRQGAVSLAALEKELPGAFI